MNGGRRARARFFKVRKPCLLPETEIVLVRLCYSSLDQDSYDDFCDDDFDYDSEEASAYAHEVAAEHYYRDSD